MTALCQIRPLRIEHLNGRLLALISPTDADSKRPLAEQQSQALPLTGDDRTYRGEARSSQFDPYETCRGRRIVTGLMPQARSALAQSMLAIGPVRSESAPYPFEADPAISSHLASNKAEAGSAST